MLEIYKSVKATQKASKAIYKVEEIEEIINDSWINLYSPTEVEIARVESELGIPQEFLRYPLDEEERPRIDFDDDTGIVLVIVDIPYTKREDDIIKYDTAPLGIIITDKNIVTVSLRQTQILEHFYENRVRDLFVAFRTRFTIQILSAVAKEYLRLLRYIDKTLEGAEKNLAKDISSNELYKLLALSKSLVYFTSSLKSNEAVLEKLMRGRTIKLYDEDEDLLEDAVIEYKQAHEMADIYANIISSTTDAYASIINNNMNDVMKFLAGITIAFTIPDIIGCFFGQNCPMPWDDTFAANPGPFLGLLFSCIICFIVSIVILRRRNLL